MRPVILSRPENTARPLAIFCDGISVMTVSSGGGARVRRLRRRRIGRWLAGADGRLRWGRAGGDRRRCAPVGAVRRRGGGRSAGRRRQWLRLDGGWLRGLVRRRCEAGYWPGILHRRRLRGECRRWDVGRRTRRESPKMTRSAPAAGPAARVPPSTTRRRRYGAWNLGRDRVWRVIALRPVNMPNGAEGRRHQSPGRRTQLPGVQAL